MLRRGEDDRCAHAGENDPRSDQWQHRDRVRNARGGPRDIRSRCVCRRARARSVSGFLRAYGAEIIETSSLEGTDGAIAEASRLVEAKRRTSISIPINTDNDANWQAHYRTTAHEIWEQTGGRAHAFRVRSRHERHVRGHVAKTQRARTLGAVVFRCSPMGRSMGSKGGSTCRRASFRGSMTRQIADF